MNPRELGYGNSANLPHNTYHYSHHPGTSNNQPPRIQQHNQGNLQMQNLSFSPLEHHNVHYHTDKLYDPLRNTLMHPEKVRYYQKEIPQAVHHSYLSKQYKLLTAQEAESIRQKTFIPRDVDLAQTDHFYKVKDKEFVAVNTETKVVGKSISPMELERIKQQGVKKSMVVYDLKEVIEEVDPITTYNPPPIQSYGKKEYRYNLYSVIDEPMNWIRDVGCKGARWFPPNQIIASKNEPQSMKWMQ